MKKMTFTLLVVLALACSVPADPVTVENFSFELPGTDKIQGWNGENGADIPGWASDTATSDSGVETGWTPTDGDWTAYLMGGDPSAYNLTDHTIAAGEEFELKYDARETWLGVDLQADLYYEDSGTRVQVATQTVTLTTTMAEFTLTFNANDVPSSVGKKIGIEFNNVTATSGSWSGIDNVRLDVTVGLVTLISPPHQGTLIDINDDLVWLLDPTVTNCDVHFGLDPNAQKNPKVIDGTVAGKLEIYDPGTLLHNTTYYWAVNPRVGTTLYLSPTWSFTTAPAEPVISTEPVGVTVASGTPAVLSVVASNATSYTWYKTPDPCNGTPGDDTIAAGPSATASLTIASTQTSDEGYYYCKASNASGDDISVVVQLLTKRLIAQWDFEGNLNDSINGWHGVFTDPNTNNPPPDPCIISDPCNIMGQVFQFIGNDLFINIPGSEDYFNFYTRGVSVSAWVKNTMGGWGAIASKHDRTDPTWIGWVLLTNGTDGVWTVRQAHGDIAGSSDITDNQWHLVTGTYDPCSGEAHVYVDGEWENGWVDTTVISPNSYPLIIGAETNAGFSDWTGLVDGVRVYSYALSPFEVAKLYTDVMGGSICAEAIQMFDFDNNCKVDINDFADLASHHLECNLVPTCWP